MTSSSSAPDGDSREQAGHHIGRYKLLQEIGEGGMGSVWMAEQQEPVKRKVALKIIKLGMDTKEVVARFEAERQALALMDHAHIAKVLDGGATERGRPFFVMELVRGVPITDYCEQHRLDTAARLELFAKVCDAIQHAHHKGIIHRDVKPTNVMVTLHDGVPVPKVIDFGIAKATNAELTQKTLFTRYQQMVGTPDYMAPEQAEMSGLDVDTRADVYSLGVLLYELLTGSTPFNAERVLAKGYSELLRTIREDIPARPSTRIRTGPRLRAELDWVVMRALEKDRSQRYETAAGLGDDVRRYLRGAPVHAVPPSLFYRLRTFTRRNRSALGVAALVLVLGGGFGWSSLSAAQAEVRRVADRSQRAVAALDVAEFALEAAIDAPISRATEWVAASTAFERVADLRAEGEIDAAVAARAERFAEGYSSARDERDLALRVEDVLIHNAAHPDLESWTRMERELAAVMKSHGVDVDEDEPPVVAQKIRGHRFARRLVDVFELWIATRGNLGSMGGPKATRATMQPWADAIFAADSDPLRTGIRRSIYSGKPPTRASVAALLQGVDVEALDARTCSWLAMMHTGSGAPELADALIRGALRRFPDNVMLNFDYGLGLSFQNRPQEAIRYFARALTVRPGAAGIWRMMGGQLAKVGELDNAREAYAEACRHEDDYAPTWIDYGDVLLRLERWNEAVAAGRRAVRAQSDLPGGHAIIGRALMGLGEPAQALPELEECERCAARDPRFREPIGEWLAACRAAMNGK
ncbi:MAG: serine/threonine-protein kinase [bacterium]|nr:serine/threonine-protein kinase [bacterium]